MNTRMPSGSVALVTGCSSGFGLLSCVELARAGMSVIASMRDLERSERLDQAMAEAGLECDKVQLDVTSTESMERAMAYIQDRHGHVDVLVNNAGFGLAGFVEELSMDEVREQFETNFFGLLALTKMVLPGMRERGRGRIINLSSASGRVAHPAFGAYAASKFAVEGLSESLRHEMRPFGVYVVLIEPGMFRTDIFERNRRIAEKTLDQDSPYREAAERLNDLVDKRLASNQADPRDVARVVVQAVTSERPRLRYVVGTDAHVMTAVRGLLPFSLWERAVGKVTGLE